MAGMLLHWRAGQARCVADHRIALTLVWCLLVMAWGAAGAGQSTHLVAERWFETRKLADFYALKSWRTEDGLPRNTINCLLASDGYLWIGTRNGLVRFDGARFRIYDAENTPELRHNNILSLAEQPRGTVWIGTMQGLVSYRDRQFTWQPVGTVVPNRIWSIAARKAGGVWLGTEFGHAYFDGTNLFGFGEHRATGSGLYRDQGTEKCEVYQLLEDKSGNLWVRYAKKIGRWRLGTDQLEVVEQIVPDDAPGGIAHGLLEDSSGAVWFGDSHGLFRCQGLQVDRVPFGQLGFRSIPGPLCEDLEGGLWFRDGDSGLAYWDGTRFLQYRAPTGMSDNHVGCAMPDREGNIWIGTEAGGLNRLQPRHLLNLTTADGLPHDSVWSISEAPDGSVWMATQGGLSRYKEGALVTFKPLPRHEDVLSSMNVVLATPTGEVFAANRWGTWQVVSNGMVQLLRTDSGTNYAVASSTLYSDRTGTLWAADNEHLLRSRADHTDWDFVLGSDSRALRFSTPIALLEDSSGAMWVGTKAGVYRLRGTRCERFSRFPAEYAGPVITDADGTMWFASDRGLIRFRNGRFFLFTTDHGLVENLVLNALEDDFGWFWLNGHRGLQRVRRADLNSVADGRARSLTCLHYGEADGMLSTEGNGGALPNSCKTRDGRLWFPTVKGVVIIDPRTIPHNTTPPPVLIEQVFANGQLIYGDAQDSTSVTGPGADPASAQRDLRTRKDFARTHRLGPGKGRTVVIHYTANSFTAPERVRFQYRLEGHDPDWIEDRAKLRTAIYTNLRPGQYRFRLRAFNNHGVASLADAELPFWLAPHFYETWIFYALCGCALLLCVGSIHQMRLNGVRRIQQLEQMHALDLERARLARDMHDNLGADLTRVMMLAEMGKSRPAGDPGEGTLERIAGLSRSMVDGISELVWATNPHKGSQEEVAAYVRARASEFLEPAGILTRFNFPHALPPGSLSGEARRQFVLALKEVLANLLKHSGATEVTISLMPGPPMFRVSVEDNGCGFSAQEGRAPGAGQQERNPPGYPKNGQRRSKGDGTAADSISGTARAGRGNGLGNVRARLEAVGGSCRFGSAPGQGALVVLEVPLARTGA